MKFPIYDISEYSWEKYRIKEHNVLYENPYSGILPSKRDEFGERISKFKFVDPDGILYKVIGFKVLQKRGLAKFLSFKKKIELEFVRTDEQYTIEEFKKLLVKRARDTKNKNLEEIAKNANSFKDILQQIT
ncbi:MAG: hypothetical protein ACERKD_02960 [Prolixibacteraceae bacterium]